MYRRPDGPIPDPGDWTVALSVGSSLGYGQDGEDVWAHGGQHVSLARAYDPYGTYLSRN
jgi:hypothetical protein